MVKQNINVEHINRYESFQLLLEIVSYDVE